MKLLYIHQYFITPNEPGGTRSYWFAKELISRGHQVTMITSKNIQKEFIERKNIEGIEVIYIRNQYSNKMGPFARLWSFLKFMTYSTWVGLKQKDIDVVYATSTPLSIGIPALIIKWLKGINYFFEVRDLWPEVPIQMGLIKNKQIIKLLYGFERKLYRWAIHIVALSPGMRDGVIKQGILASKITIIPNMAKKDEFYQRAINEEIAKEFNLAGDTFKAIHFGAMGVANGLEYLIEAAKVLNSLKLKTEIEIVFLGTGATEEVLKDQCKKFNLTNVKFLGPQPLKTVSKIVNICQCSIVSFANIPILYTNSPNKLFDSLSAGKPIIVNSPGWTKDLVEEHNCGVYTDPDNPKELAGMLIKMSESENWIRDMGNNSRRTAESVYDKTILCRQFADVLERYTKV